MNICMKLSVCLTALVPIALAQKPDFQRVNTTAPVAYVYVSRPTHIDGFAASASGELTPVPGSPFPNISVAHMSVNKKFLFGTDSNENKYVYTFSIGSNGALTKVAETNVIKYVPNTCCGLGLQIDPSGSTLYVAVAEYIKNVGTEPFLESFKIEENGELQYLGKEAVAPYTISELRFAPSTHYAYQTGCLVRSLNPGQESATPITSEFKRESNGFLTFLGTNDDTPPAHGSKTFCPFALASDSTDHLAFVYFTAYKDTELVPGMPIGTYTVSSEGKLTTKSNYDNMPDIDVYPHTASISPTSKLLAVGGGSAFQLFHFNGAEPITKFSAAIPTNDNLLEFGWDKTNHLYSLTGSGLVVYTVTPTSYTQAPGSPYSIPEAGSVIVLTP